MNQRTNKSSLTKIGMMLSLLSIILAAMVLVGWASEVSILKRGIELSVAMNPATATAFIFLGYAIIGSSHPRFLNYRFWYFATLTVIIGSTMKLSDATFGTSFGIDTYLFATKLSAESDFPSRMAPNTALAFFILSLSLLLISTRSNLAIIIGQFLTILTVLIALLVVVGYVYHLDSFQGIGRFIPMAVNTAIGFLLLSVATLLIHSSKGFMPVLVNDGPAGSIALLLLPSSVVLPFLFDWISQVGQGSGLYNANPSAAISDILNVITLLCLTYFIARKVFIYDNLKKKEALFRQKIIESLPGIFYVFDTSGHFQSWNRVFEEITGRSADEIKQSHPLDYFDTEEKPQIAETIQRVLTSGQAVVEANFITKNGNRIPYLFTGIREDLNGYPIVIGVGIDISERKRAEVNLKDSEALMYAVFDNVSVGIAQVSIDGYFLKINQEFCRIIRYSQDEILSQRLSFQQITFPEDLDLDLKNINQLLNGICNRFSMEKRYLRKDGSMVWVDLSVYLLRNETGVPLYFIVAVQDISERKQLEMRLRENERNLSSVINNIPDYLLRYDRQHRHIFANERSSRDSAKPKDEFLGKTHRELGFPEHLCALWESAIDRCFSEKQPQTEIFEWESANGKVVLEWRAIPEFSDDAEVETVLGISRDITQLRQIESALIQSEARFRLMFEHNDAVMLLIEPVSGKIVDANISAVRFYGYPIERLKAMNIEQINILPPGIIRENRMEAARRQRNFFFFPHRLANGKVRTVEVHTSPIEVADKTLLFSIVQDVTEHQQAEARLVKLSEEQQAILQSKLVGFLISRNRIITWSNLTLDDMLGYEPGTLLNQPSKILYSNEEQWSLIGQKAYPVIMSGGVFRTQLQLVKQDGTLGWYDIAGTQLHTEGDDTIWAFIDISRQKRTESELVEARRQAEAANLAKSRFLATMSHEIRTPMNGILGMAQMLLMPDLTDNERKDYARTILTSGQILLNLLNDILDLSKVEAGKITLNSSVFNPAQILSEISALFTETARLKALTIHSAWIGPADQCYLGDTYRLSQMLSNLVGNAIKFTLQGQIHIEIREIERDEQSALLEFAISDTGIGIPKDKQAQLFQPFSQLDSSTTRQFGGSGLGLSIVRSLANLMGGSVGCESELGQGSRFWFRCRAKLIAVDIDHRFTDHTNPDDHSVHLTTPLSGRVLVAEDNLVNRNVITAMLKQFGMMVTLAEDGQQAMEAIMGGDPADLILMDLHMPIMDGYVATQRIRQWEIETGRPRRPIIALTADAFEDDKRRCLTVGMDDFLSKPIMIATLTQVLNRWLGSQSMPVSVGSPLPVMKTIDVPSIMSIMRKLVPLLEKNKFDAIDHFNALQEKLLETEVSEEIVGIGQLLEEFNFNSALEKLRQILATQGWQDESV